MKSYTITVNGTAYEVTVEETGSVSAPAAAPKAAPKAAPAAAPKAATLKFVLRYKYSRPDNFYSLWNYHIFRSFFDIRF